MNDWHSRPPARIKANDEIFLKSLVDNSNDMFVPDIFERLEPMFAVYENDAQIMALLTQASKAYGDEAAKAALTALDKLDLVKPN